jgi:hypothetical protein
MRRSFVLAWRLHRWEIGAVTVVALALSGVGLRIVLDLDQVAAMCRAATEMVPPCGSLRDAGMVYDMKSQTAMYLVKEGLWLLPFAAGVVLGAGAPLVAREREQGTAHIGWPLSRSRARWLAVRLLPLAVLGALLLAIPALAGEILERPYHQLPAILVSAAVIGASAWGLGQTAGLWLEPQPQGEAFQPIEHLGRPYVGMRFRLDGEWISEEEAIALMTVEEGEPEPDPALMPKVISLAIPADRYPEVMVRESLLPSESRPDLPPCSSPPSIASGRADRGRLLQTPGLPIRA